MVKSACMNRLLKTLIVVLMMLMPAFGGYSFTHPLDESHLNSRLKGHLSGKAHVINEAARKYDVEARLLAAIICYESGWGTSKQARTLHNYSGTRFKPKYHDFSKPFTSDELKPFNAYSVADRCIYYTAYNISKRYKNTKKLEDIGRKYCGKSGAAFWAKQVRSIYHSLPYKKH